jgi:hypothetical protein
MEIAISLESCKNLPFFKHLLVNIILCQPS